MRLTKETLFKPSRAESKQAATDSTARAMAEAEAETRRKKTERLREARLAREAGRNREDIAGNDREKPKKPAARRT